MPKGARSGQRLQVCARRAFLAWTTKGEIPWHESAAAYHNSPASTLFREQKNAIEFEPAAMPAMAKRWDFRLIKGTENDIANGQS